jgi:hypothetical protein
MPSFQCRELLAKSEVFEQQTAMTAEESEDRTDQEYKCVYHMRVLSRFACEWQCRILLKSQADRVLAKDTGLLIPSEKSSSKVQRWTAAPPGAPAFRWP